MSTERSSYLDFLPSVYHDDDFLGRFLLIFESVLSPVERFADSAHHYFDPRLTPPELLPWLASWVGLVLDEAWPEERRRQLIRSAVELYAWRGTRRGMTEMLQLYTGYEVEIEELGLKGRAQSKEAGANAHRFKVTIKAPAGTSIDRRLVERIIRLEQPAHTVFELGAPFDTEKPSSAS